ncbi:hypothetical protein GGS24DRAFT_511378 [Hypoxylon argillaceum]|nr:hypothetical protein GGS24DRAFT_511378 [Hypoxylon argillaceum]
MRPYKGLESVTWLMERSSLQFYSIPTIAIALGVLSRIAKCDHYLLFMGSEERVTGLGLRELNIDTNRLSYCEVKSEAEPDALCLSRSNARSGILYICELQREFDKNAPNYRLPMSELLWQSYAQEYSNSHLLSKALTSGQRLKWCTMEWKDERDLKLTTANHIKLIEEFQEKFGNHISDITPEVIDHDSDAEDP